VPPKDLRELSAVKLGKEKTRTVLPFLVLDVPSLQAPYLANTLEDRDDLLEVADMEDWKNKFDVTEMTIALLQTFYACIAPVVLIGYAHPLVERSMGIDSSIALKIEQTSIGDFDERLVGNVGIGPVRHSIIGTEKVSGSLQDTKLQFFDHLGHSINHLYLSPIRQAMVRSLHLHTRPVATSIMRLLEVSCV
jgi:hypothetical protein